MNLLPHIFYPIDRYADYPSPEWCNENSDWFSEEMPDLGIPISDMLEFNNCTNTLSYSGLLPPGGWIDSGMNDAFLSFESDGSVTNPGFKISFRCQEPSLTTLPPMTSPTSTTTNTRSTTTNTRSTTTTSSYFDCQMYEDPTTGLSTFETSNPYLNNLNCQEEFSCSGYGESVHFEFLYFQTEPCCDGLYISNDIGDELFSYFGEGPVNIWTNTGDAHVNFRFFTDGSVTGAGFKMNLKCLNTISTTTVNLTASIVTAFEYSGALVFT